MDEKDKSEPISERDLCGEADWVPHQVQRYIVYTVPMYALKLTSSRLPATPTFGCFAGVEGTLPAAFCGPHDLEMVVQRLHLDRADPQRAPSSHG